MRKWAKRLFIGFSVILAYSSAFAQDAAEISKNIIQRQIEAFLDDDADTAYSFASPDIQALYPDKSKFFAMVRKNYEPVFRPGNYAFGRFKTDKEFIYQEVLITGPNGKDWSAIYQLIQDGSNYKINGVQILPNTESKGI